jgi:Cft2 family RNA processing exonuclease
MQAPVYATLPVHRMGQMFMYDQYSSRTEAADFDVFDLDDVDAAFARVKTLRFQQNLALTGVVAVGAGTARRAEGAWGDLGAGTAARLARVFYP